MDAKKKGGEVFVNNRNYNVDTKKSRGETKLAHLGVENIYNEGEASPFELVLKHGEDG